MAETSSGGAPHSVAIARMTATEVAGESGSLRRHVLRRAAVSASVALEKSNDLALLRTALVRESMNFDSSRAAMRALRRSSLTES